MWKDVDYKPTVLDHIIDLGQSSELMTSVSLTFYHRALPLVGLDRVLLNHAVASEHAKDSLQALGVSTSGWGADLDKDLCDGQGSARATDTNGAGNNEVDYSTDTIFGMREGFKGLWRGKGIWIGELYL